jgi:hypothetical protein
MLLASTLCRVLCFSIDMFFAMKQDCFNTTTADNIANNAIFLLSALIPRHSTSGCLQGYVHVLGLAGVDAQTAVKWSDNLALNVGKTMASIASSLILWAYFKIRAYLE